MRFASPNLSDYRTAPTGGHRHMMLVAALTQRLLDVVDQINSGTLTREQYAAARVTKDALQAMLDPCKPLT